jgi:hypothetical protein
VKPHIPGRLHAQGLTSPRFTSAAEVVRHLGCAQSQLHDMALWSLARRTTGATLAELQASFDDGDFLRTHVLRPTWHFVDAADVPWLQALTGPRVARLLSATNRTIALSDDTVRQGVAVVVEALAAGTPCTRAELGARLTDAGLPGAGQPLAHVVMQAELEHAVVNGPMRGKQHTYRLLSPTSTLPPRDEMLADVARRYAAGHGSFRAKDLAWWTSLTLTDSRRAVAAAELSPATIDGEEYWTLDDPVDADVPRVMLLSSFDEYVSYARDPADYTRFTGTAGDVMRGSGLLMIDGRLAGRWARTISATRVVIDIDRAAPLSAVLRRHLEAEAEAFGHFLGLDPEIVVRP